MHEDATNMESNLKDRVSSKENDRFSSCSFLNDDEKVMDDLSTNEATSFFDEESVYASSTYKSDEIASIFDDTIKHVLLDNEVSFEGNMEKCVDLVDAAMDPMKEEVSMDYTREVGKKEDLWDAGLQVFECIDHHSEDMCFEGIKIKGNCVENPNLDAGKVDDL